MFVAGQSVVLKLTARAIAPQRRNLKASGVVATRRGTLGYIVKIENFHAKEHSRFRRETQDRLHSNFADAPHRLNNRGLVYRPSHRCRTSPVAPSSRSLPLSRDSKGQSEGPRHLFPWNHAFGGFEDHPRHPHRGGFALSQTTKKSMPPSNLGIRIARLSDFRGSGNVPVGKSRLGEIVFFGASES